MSDQSNASLTPARAPRVRDPVVRALLWMIAIPVVVGALRAIAPIAAPLAFALFIAALLWPVQAWLDRRVPRTLAVAATALLALVIVGAVGVMVGFAIDAVARHVPAYAGRMEEMRLGSLQWLEQVGLEAVVRDIRLEDLAAQASRAVQAIATFAADIVWKILLILIFLLLALPEVPQWVARMQGEKLVDTGREIAHRFRRFVATRTVTSGLTGILTGLTCWIVGLELALVWGIVAWVLNYVPTLGSILAVLAPSAFAVLQFGSLPAAVGLAGVLLVLQLIVGNYVDPRMQGSSLKISPLLVLVSIVFWGWMWGVLGALLGVPLTVALLLVSARYESTRWVAHLALAEGAEEAEGEGAE